MCLIQTLKKWLRRAFEELFYWIESIYAITVVILVAITAILIELLLHTKLGKIITIVLITLFFIKRC